ncbi:MAG TPA: GNAT family N-acetyltransferase, partial [Longimicrobiaceae bacterium]|nr:GNAT family N-acetyltransferase [Longimicrobiaceae bacterium]
MPRLSRIVPAVLAACALSAGPVLAQRAAPLRTGEDLIRAMHARYAGQWYRTLSFTQATSRVMADSVHVEMWREWALVPGALRIDMGDPAAHNGALFKGDSLFVIQGGRVARRIARRNPLMVLGFDVYGQSPERSLQVLREEGFNTAPLREDTFEGRPVYVVGA